MTKSCTFIFLILAFAAPAFAAPAELILLRHGEKPAEGSTLNARGYERAKALATLFEQDGRVLGHGRAVAIFSARPSKAGGSVRSIETMNPTANALGIPLSSSFTKDEIAGLVKAVLSDPGFEGKTVIICWEHKKIPEIVRAFGWNDAPKRWEDSVFDRLWVLDFEAGKPTHFSNLPQKLLPGDSSS